MIIKLSGIQVLTKFVYSLNYFWSNKRETRNGRKKQGRGVLLLTPSDLWNPSRFCKASLGKFFIMIFFSVSMLCTEHLSLGLSFSALPLSQ